MQAAVKALQIKQMLTEHAKTFGIVTVFMPRQSKRHSYMHISTHDIQHMTNL